MEDEPYEEDEREKREKESGEVEEEFLVELAVEGDCFLAGAVFG